MFWLVLRRRWNENARLRIALYVSLGLHGIAALFFPTFATAPAATVETMTTISYQRVQHVALQSRPTAPHSVAALNAKRVVLPHIVRQRATAPTHKARATKPHRHAVPKPTPGAATQTQRFAVGGPSASPVPATPAPVALTRTTAPSIAAPSAAPAPPQEHREIPNAHGSGTRSGIGMFGEIQDPALAKPVMDQLLRRFKLNVTLIVTVGDDGRTKQIEFHPPITPAVENQIRTLLADANWDPALCGGGIACEGKATIKLSE
ncbi:MAG: hypothetical protein JO024_03880 [Candidatus Eremiobacteraeota bacterium]|nr:hypothetical protein [Candidatus Eremiobacteraeota bacterium]